MRRFIDVAGRQRVDVAADLYGAIDVRQVEVADVAIDGERALHVAVQADRGDVGVDHRGAAQVSGRRRERAERARAAGDRDGADVVGSGGDRD